MYVFACSAFQRPLRLFFAVDLKPLRCNANFRNTPDPRVRLAGLLRQASCGASRLSAVGSAACFMHQIAQFQLRSASVASSSAAQGDLQCPGTRLFISSDGWIVCFSLAEFEGVERLSGKKKALVLSRSRSDILLCPLRHVSGIPGAFFFLFLL